MTPFIAKIVFVLGAIAWFAIRFPHQRRADRTPVRASARGGRETLLLLCSLTGLGFVPFAYIATGFPRFADYPFIPALAWAGTVSFLAALLLFHRTHRALGRYWSVSLEVRQDHRLITDGIYAHVRHPMYSAFFLWALAQVLLLPNWIAGPAGLIGFGILFFGRVEAEEKLMLAEFGEQYQDYMKRSARVIPGLY